MKLKEYKGVGIFVDPKGLFYCDPVKNDGIRKTAVFKSEKVTSIEKAIDAYEGKTEENGDKYYAIISHQALMTELTVASRVGNRLFFTDGTNTTMSNRKHLFGINITESREFAAMKEQEQLAKDINDQLAELRDKLLVAHKEFRKNLCLIEARKASEEAR